MSKVMLLSSNAVLTSFSAALAGIQWHSSYFSAVYSLGRCHSAAVKQLSLVPVHSVSKCHVKWPSGRHIPFMRSSLCLFTLWTCTLRFKSLGSVRYIYIFLVVEINTFIQQGCIKLIKSDSKDMYNEDLWEHNSSKLIMRNVSWAANQHIRMISERSCDTEDWSNDAGNSALHHRNKLHFKMY